jgi:hypothetical protein
VLLYRRDWNPAKALNVEEKKAALLFAVVIDSIRFHRLFLFHG